jgi:ferredoxin
VVDDYAAPSPSSRATLQFGAARDGAVSRCDILLDLSGGAPLFSAPDLLDGYVRADPGDLAAVLRAVLKARDLVGTFDKPRYITFTENICAHSRSGIVGCNRCLDLCPTGAIAPAGDHVAIDAHICAGCGQCAAVCPTGAASYALPPADVLMRKLRALLMAYRDAGGERAIVLLHDDAHGAPLIDALARFGDGLPANVLPLAVNEVTQVGLEAIAAAFAYGAAGLRLLFMNLAVREVDLDQFALYPAGNEDASQWRDGAKSDEKDRNVCSARHLRDHRRVEIGGQQLEAWQRIIDLRDQAGQPVRVTGHQFRHTLGTRLINSGVPQHVVQKLLGHASPHMTSHYAKIHDATIREAFDRYQAQRINITGQRIGYDPDAPTASAEWVKHNLNRVRDSLPNGYCARPAQQDCPHPNACLTCPDFQTTPVFLQIHRRQAATNRRLIAQADANGRQRLAENLRRVQASLDRIIPALEALDGEGPRDDSH